MKESTGIDWLGIVFVGVWIFVSLLLGACKGSSSDSGVGGSEQSPYQAGSAMIIDHNCTNIDIVPEAWVEEAKSALHIAYGHTSHGSQLTTGMTGLVGFRGDLYAYNSGGTGGALDLRDTPFSGASDLGNPDRTSWATATRNYLDAHTDVNVIIWSW